MKKLIFAFLLIMAYAGVSMAFTEQFQIFDNGPKTKSCRTANLNITNEREPVFCSYVFTPYRGGKKEGTLLFEFLMNPDNPTSVNIKNEALAVLKELKNTPSTEISLSLELTGGERLYFDPSTIHDWSTGEWRQLIHVTYDRDNGDYRTYIMFPIEQLWSSTQKLSSSSKSRHKYILKRLQNANIDFISIKATTPNDVIQLTIPFQRPTKDTFNNMVQRIKKGK